MRSSPYPVPPSRRWQAKMVAGYGVLAIAGVLVLVLVPVLYSAVTLETIGLMIWGLLTGPAGIVCTISMVRAYSDRPKHRWEWIGARSLATGAAVYVLLSSWSLLAGGIAALPGLLVFGYVVTSLAARADHLGWVDKTARERVLARQTGEIPEVTDQGDADG